MLFNASMITDAYKKQKIAKKNGDKDTIRKNALHFVTVIVLENIKEAYKSRPQTFAPSAKAVPVEAEFSAVVVDCEETLAEINKTNKTNAKSLGIPRFVKGSKNYEMDDQTPLIPLKDGDMIHIRSTNCKLLLLAGDKLKLFSVIDKEFEKSVYVDKVKTGTALDSKLEFGFCRLLSQGHLRDLVAMNVCKFPDVIDPPSPYIVAGIRTIFGNKISGEQWLPGTSVGVVVDASKRDVGAVKDMATYSVTIYEVHQTEGEDSVIINNEIQTEMFDITTLKSSDADATVGILSHYNIPFVAVLKINAKKTGELALSNDTGANKIKASYSSVEWGLYEFLEKMPPVSKDVAIEWSISSRLKYTSYDNDVSGNVQNLSICTPTVYEEIKGSDDWEFRALPCKFNVPLKDYVNKMDLVVQTFTGAAVGKHLNNEYSDAVQTDDTLIEVFAIKTSNIKRKRE